MASGTRVLTTQVAGRLMALDARANRKPKGELPKCRKCGKPLRIGERYHSRQLAHRAYYHLSCWERTAYGAGR